MAVPTDFNTIGNISRTLKGYFTIKDGSIKYRYKLLQDVITTTVSDFEKFYSDDGEKSLLSIGDSSTFSLRVKKTADLWDTVNSLSTTQVRTIGFYQNAIINDRLIPEAEFEGVSETDAGTNRFIVITFTAFITGIEDTRNPETGAPEVVISGEIKSLIESKRQLTAPT